MMKKYKILISACILLLMVCTVGCQTKGEEKVHTEIADESSQVIDEMVVAVNVDSSENVLPFESVLLNRSKFWGSLIFQGLLIADENISNVKPDLCEEIFGKAYRIVCVFGDSVYRRFICRCNYFTGQIA